MRHVFVTVVVFGVKGGRLFLVLVFCATERATKFAKKKAKFGPNRKRAPNLIKISALEAQFQMNARDTPLDVDT
jgi:hypothetical protein